jgi:hypothetical protein
MRTTAPTHSTPIAPFAVLPLRQHASEKSQVPIDPLADIARASTAVCSALALLVSQTADVPREKVLRERWQIDRSLVGRVCRGLRIADPLAFAAELPSAEGLAIIAQAARRAGATPAALASFSDASKAWSALVDRFPDKRRGLRALLAMHDPDIRSRADLAARRAMFRHAAEVLGYSMRHTVGAMFISPSSKASSFDATLLFGKFGLTRSRPGCAPITVMGIHPERDNPGREFQPLDCDTYTKHAEQCMLREHCRGEALLELYMLPSRAIEVRLPAHSPAIHQPVDLVCTQRVAGMLDAHRSTTTQYEWYEALPRIPTESLTLDLFFHKDVYPSAIVTSSARLFAAGPPSPPLPGCMSPDGIASYARIDHLPMGLTGIGLRDVPNYTRIVHETARQAGLNPAEYRCVRATVAYPMLMVGITLWIPLPDAPEVEKRT